MRKTKQTYIRARDLKRLYVVPGWMLSDNSEQGTMRILSHLMVAITDEKMLRTHGSSQYSIKRHKALDAAYSAECEHLTYLQSKEAAE